ncbi:MAG: radical SAM protein [Bacteroidales bacterium]|nr:radical SAM protein [Bacteroidales bacterium]MBN2817590.1 radical SAM protein [Bacteroidales bacterium]
MKDLSKHPCFNKEAKSEHGRVHLPIAPKCNIQCNYCDRKYDCVNESRPGVTSSVLTPKQAIAYLKDLKTKLPNLSVVGIAGPGDPFANPEETMETLRLVNEEFPEMLSCLSTNGVNLMPYIDQLAEYGVSHVTITINSLDPEVLGKIYHWIRADKRVLRGNMAGEEIIKRQLACIPLLKAKGMIVKINTIVVPGVNDHCIEELAAKTAELGADVMNCIPLYPNKNTPFENVLAPTHNEMQAIRAKILKHIKPMTHCARCRADAAGLLGQDYKGAMDMLREYSSKPTVPVKERPYVAVASFEGMLVNQHLGESKELFIYRETPNGYRFVEKRETPVAGNGERRWLALSSILNDCRALLTGGAGPSPVRVLESSGIRVIQMTGLIDNGLDVVYKGKVLRTIKKADAFKCGQSCSGNAAGCG